MSVAVIGRDRRDHLPVPENRSGTFVHGSNRAVMFVCGDEQEGKDVVMQLVSDVGFQAVDAGRLESARKLEELALLWIHLGYHHPDLGRKFAFSILRRL